MILRASDWFEVWPYRAHAVGLMAGLVIGMLV